MRKLLIVPVVISLVFTSVMWLTAEKTLDDVSKKNGKLETEKIILEGSYKAEKQTHKQTADAYTESLRKAAELEKQNADKQNTITQLQRQLQVEKSRASRSSSQPRKISSVAPDTMGADFWRRLANCESADGRSGTYIGYFQFSRDTAAKLGIDGSESYEEQKAAAIEWARRIHPREGTTSGWPRCWWVALKGA